MDIEGISETRRHGSGETSSKGFTYYWSGMSNGHHVKGVAIGISSRLQPFVVEATPVGECMVQLRLKDILGFISVVVVYAPNKVCKTEEKEIFYTKLESLLDQFPITMHSSSWATLLYCCHWY